MPEMKIKVSAFLSLLAKMARQEEDLHEAAIVLGDMRDQMISLMEENADLHEQVAALLDTSGHLSTLNAELRERVQYQDEMIFNLDEKLSQFQVTEEQTQQATG